MVVLLTRKCHEDSVWITRLVEALQTRAADNNDSGGRRGGGVQVLAVGDLLARHGDDAIHLLLSKGSPLSGGRDVLVNRVSDAADPVTVKFTTSLLQAARVWGVPVFNGPISYSLCASKWCHHVVLDRAGLTFPETRLVTLDALILSDDGDDNNGSTMDRKTSTAAAVRQQLPPFPLLLKPNAGGFGRGIQRVESFQELQAVARSLNGETSSSTEPVLLQTYVEPKDQLIYRVWYLQGRVQCAVTRRTGVLSTVAPVKGTATVSSNNEFSSGCVGGNVCSRPPVTRNTVSETTTLPGVVQSIGFRSGSSGESHYGPSPSSIAADDPETATFRAWEVPGEVVDEVQRIVQVLEDAQAGSVEFLYGRDNGKRYYFDVNLLSTLPLPETKVANRDEVWSPSYDPWDELAAAIFEAEDQSHGISSVSEMR